jgi:Polyketide cyclase / dehydrase and lipid transport
MTDIAPKTDRTRVRFQATQHVDAAPEAVFPLLCPVRELDWIPAWECEVIFTESGLAEEGCVFQTDTPDGGGLDTWVVSRYEPPRRISFVRVNRLRTLRYDIRLEPGGDGSTTLCWEQEITALNDDGDRHVASLRPEDFATMVATGERLLEHYLKTGEALRTEYRQS